MDKNLYSYNNVPSGLPVVPKKNNAKKYVLVAILFVLFIAVILWYFQNSGGVKPEKIFGVVVNQVAANELPKDFPTDIPLETGADIIANYNAINAAGKYQASREFVSKKSVAENFALYQKALKDNGWEITSVEENASAGSLIFAQKNNYNLNVRIYIGPDNKVRVSISNIVG